MAGSHAVVEGINNSPLQLLSGSELYQLVTPFYFRYMRDEVDERTLQRGAYLVRDRDTFMQQRVVDALPESNQVADPTSPHGTSRAVLQSVPVLSREDKCRTRAEDEALKNEKNGKLACLTKDAIVVLATCAMGAIVQGWSQENIVLANNYWPGEFGVKENRRIMASVNAITYFTASLGGVWLTDPLSSYFGRRGSLLCSAICSFIAPIGAATSQCWITLLVSRAIQGLGMGAKGAIIPVLMAEVCPPALRARVLVGWQTFVALGILIGAIVNKSLEATQNWRWALGLSAVPALTLACSCYVIPESPRWLVEKHEYTKAYQALNRLRPTRLQASGELYLLHTYSRIYTISEKTLTASILQRVLRDSAPKPTQSPYLEFIRRLRDLWRDPRNRRAAFAACTVMAAQQLSGINIFAFVSPPGSGDDAFMTMDVKAGFGAVNFVFSAVAYFLIEPLGRRTLLLASLALMAPALGVLAYSVGADKAEDMRNLSIAFIMIYTAIYSPGAGVIPFMYSAEVFGQKHRQVGMSLAVATNFSLAGVVACVPLSATFQTWRKPILFFVAASILAVFLVWVFMRTSGTRASTLEDMHELFAEPLKDWVRYQLHKIFPKSGTNDRYRGSFRKWCRDERFRNTDDGSGSENHELSQSHNQV